MISVCMATYNGEKFILEQINSILSQIGKSDELIISDDGSTDKTLDIVTSINDPRIKVYNNTNEKGYTGNFYSALAHASGDYIFLSDQDDVWADNKISITLKYLKKYDFVVSDCYETNELLEIINKSRFQKYNVKAGFIHSLLMCRYIGCCMAFTKNVLNVMFPPPSYKNHYPHDLWIALIGELYFKHTIIPEKLIYYRRHSSNASNGGDNSEAKRSIWVRVFSRFYYFIKVIIAFPRVISYKKKK